MTRDKKWSWLADDTKIAGEYRVIHWKELRVKDKLDENSDGKKWSEAVKIFETRVNTRFLDPIDEILGMYVEEGKEIYPVKGKGEGFSAVALQCILIEFFGAFYGGWIFDLNPKRNSYEYKSNEVVELIYEPFLTVPLPFSKFFCKCKPDKCNISCDNKVHVNTFYDNFRCGLIHEAATKGLAIIRAEQRNDDDMPTDPNHEVLIEKPKEGKLKGKIVLYRTPFQKALKQYLKNYKNKLISGDKTLRKRFIRKMDDLCQIPKP